VHVVWLDNRDGNNKIYYKRSIDGGLNWGIDTRLTNNTADIWYPTVEVSGQVVHVIWMDSRDGNMEIYYKRSPDNGDSWGTDTRQTNDPGPSMFPSFVVAGLVIHIVWMDDRDGNKEIYYKRSTDGGMNWGTNTRLTYSAGGSWYPTVAISDSIVHVVWHDTRDGNDEIYYKRDPTGNPIGIKIISSKVPVDFMLYQNYPNPFNPVTKMKFSISSNSFIKLVVYDALGREAETLVNEELKPGTYEAEWDGTNYPCGIYFYTLYRGDYKVTKRMILLK
jgi:hypothetical protein